MGISIVTACKNREENLLKVLPTWLDSHADEIVIVDWSCTKPLHKTMLIEGITDERIVIYRVENEERWILTHAYNVGLKRASHELILKLDNDHAIEKDFFETNDLSGLDTRLGSWRLAKSADQAYINGAFLIRSGALRDIGFFNETITTYGWDDSYLHETLFANGAKISHLCPDSIKHIEQEEETRTKYQKVNREGVIAAHLGVKTTEYMNRRNMYLTALLPRQTANTVQSTYTLLDNSDPRVHILHRATSPHLDIPSSYFDMADRLAFRDFFCWHNGLRVELTCISEVEEHFAMAAESEPQISTSSKCDELVDEPSTANNVCASDPFSRDTLKSNLSKYLPLLLSAYGHTDNENKYSLRCPCSEKAIDEINSYLPQWCRDKVCLVNQATPDDYCQQIDTSIAGIQQLIGKLVLLPPEENQYFWAAFNSLASGHKRSLYDFIESAGKPYQVLANYFLASALGDSSRGIDPQAYLKALAAIYPLRDSSQFLKFANDYNQKLITLHGSNYRVADSTLEGIAADVDSSKLTLVTSLYKGLNYIVDYSLNLKRMHLFDRTDVIIYVVPSPEATSAHRYLANFFRKDLNVKVHLLDNDPGLYECWNMGIQSAESTYVSNANADDRRGRYHSDYLIFLAELLHLDAVSSALVTDIEPTQGVYSETQDVWFTGMGRRITKDDLYLETDEGIESQNFLHCMPIWRRSIHDRIGFFDERQYGTSCDWEFWLRSASAGMHMRLLDLPLGFYLLDQTSHNRRNLEARRAGEQGIIQTHISTEVGISSLQ